MADGLERLRGGADLLDLAEVDLPFADGRAPEEAGGDLPATLGRIQAAPSVLLATPVYRGSCTGALKNLLDLTPVEALEGKPVALLAMGATQHHFLGPDRHLRDVLAFFGAHVTPVAGYLTSSDFQDGVPGERAAAEVDALLAGLLELARTLPEPPGVGVRPLLKR